MDSEFWAAIAGAVVGGLISLGVQLLAFRYSKKQAKDAKQDTQIALAKSLLLKTMKINAHLNQFQKHNEFHFKLADEQKLGAWQVVKAFANLPQQIHFSTDELTLLLSLNADDLFNEIVMLDEIHNDAIELFRTYKEMRGSLTQLLPSKMEGSHGIAELTPEQLFTLRPKMVELEALAQDIKIRCEQDTSESWSCLTKLMTTFRDKLGLKLTVEKRKQAPTT
ncbi:MAG: hypothetical protein JNM81_00485 [Rhodospirillaceae bacterium]|nr:hypothetical protein [Rhodospirillaceae bacterium]